MKTELSLGQQVRRRRLYFCYFFGLCVSCCMHHKDQTCHISHRRSSVSIAVVCNTRGRVMQRGQKKMRAHFFHLVSWCSRENTSGEGKAALLSLRSQQGIWCVLVAWKATAVVISIKMLSFCPGPPATPSRKVVALLYSTSCTLTLPSLQPVVLDKSGT